MKRQFSFTICIVLALALIGTQPVSAQTRSASTPLATSVPLEEVLNSDGALDLDRGFQGSLDPTGWQMVIGANGAPRFAEATAADDANWDPQFVSGGPESNVYAIAVSGSNVYAGGLFKTAGGSAVNYVAKWDGNTWSALGSGVRGVVYAIAVSGSDVYVGGNFTEAGGITVNGIAKWDGSNWSALGSGVSGGIPYVKAIAVNGSDVYAGGAFTTAGGITVNGIAKWDGSNWSALGSGVSGGATLVKAIAVNGSDIYVAGDFSRAGGLSANRIARWDGSNWLPLGSGIIGTVVGLAVGDNDLYVGGSFSTAGGVLANGLARWDGDSWSALSGSVKNGSLTAIAFSGGKLYVGAGGGTSITIGGVPGPIASWDGSGWSALGSGVQGAILSVDIGALTTNGSEVYVGGNFSVAGGVAASRIARWDGESWSGFGHGNAPSYDVRAIAVEGTDVYVGGTFRTAGEAVVNRIAMWDGSDWSALGSGVNGYAVYAIAVDGSDVYVGGNFTEAGGVAASGIAKWDGDSWSALGSGVGGIFTPYVSAIAIAGSDVYVGGQFTQAGGIPANSIARWDGSSWSALGSGVGGTFSFPAEVSAIAIDGSDIYVGGQFTQAGGVLAPYIAKWDGSNWSALGSGLSGGYSTRVQTIAIRDGEVYVGGDFTKAGGVVANRIARWDGKSWSALGSGVGGIYYYTLVFAIAFDKSDVYIGGVFDSVDGKSTNNIARWDGTSWSVLGSGLNSTVLAMDTGNDGLYVGGGFTTAGGKPSSYFGRYVFNTPPAAGAGGPYELDEGASVTVTASGSDPENGLLTYAWDLDDDGSFETPGQSVTFSAATLDGPGTSTIRVQVTDEGGLTATASTTVDVRNVAPTATFTSTPVTLLQGQSATLAFGNPFDPSAADTAAGFFHSFDCTNNGTFEVAGSVLASFDCLYPSAGTFTALGRIADKDGDFTEYTVQVKVLTPKDGTEGLIDQVLELVPGSLNEGQGHALIAKLEAVIQQLERGNVTAALNQLEAFINEVNADISSGKLTLEAAQPLLEAAEAIIASLGG